MGTAVVRIRVPGGVGGWRKRFRLLPDTKEGFNNVQSQFFALPKIATATILLIFIGMKTYIGEMPGISRAAVAVEYLHHPDS